MISYNAQGVKLPTFLRRRMTTWIRSVAAKYGKKVGDVGYLFVTDEYILEVNKTYLSHDYYTDIITFDYSTAKAINGDIMISVDTVEGNAKRFHRPFMEELCRVIIHGVLHLCGLNDKTPAERRVMKKAENEALSMYEK